MHSFWHQQLRFSISTKALSSFSTISPNPRGISITGKATCRLLEIGWVRTWLWGGKTRTVASTLSPVIITQMDIRVQRRLSLSTIRPTLLRVTHSPKRSLGHFAKPSELKLGRCLAFLELCVTRTPIVSKRSSRQKHLRGVLIELLHQRLELEPLQTRLVHISAPVLQGFSMRTPTLPSVTQRIKSGGLIVLYFSNNLHY